MNDDAVFVHSLVQKGEKLCDYVNKNCCFKDGHTFVVSDNKLSLGKKSSHVTLKCIRGAKFKFSAMSKLQVSSKKQPLTTTISFAHLEFASDVLGKLHIHFMVLILEINNHDIKRC